MDDLHSGKTKGKIKKRHWEVNVIKDQTGEMPTDEATMKEGWTDYFSNLLSVENVREQLGEVPAVEGPVQEISREDVKKAIESTNKGKLQDVQASR